MPAVPTVPTFNEGVLPTSLLSQHADATSWLRSPPIVQLQQIAVQSIPNGTFTPLTWTQEDVDPYNGHDSGVNPSRYTAVYPGWYQLSGAVAFAPNVAGNRITQWWVNGAALGGCEVSLPAASAVNNTVIPARTIITQLSVGDYVELAGWQLSGGALNTATGGNSRSSMTAIWQSA